MIVLIPIFCLLSYSKNTGISVTKVIFLSVLINYLFTNVNIVFFFFFFFVYSWVEDRHVRAYIYFTDQVLDLGDSKAHKLLCSQRRSKILSFWKVCSPTLYFRIEFFSNSVLWSLSLIASDILSKMLRLTDYLSQEQCFEFSICHRLE